MTSPPSPAPELRGDGLLLRPWAADDSPAVLRLADDPVSRRWSPSLRRVHTAADAERWISSRQQHGTNWAVTDPGTGDLLGRVGLHHFDAEDNCAEIGYGVMASARGRRVARRAVEIAVRYGFDELALTRIALEHALGNAPSCAVARACGFPVEGVKRSAISRGDGGYDDAHLHARLPSDPPVLDGAPAAIAPVEIVAGAYQLCVPDPDLDAAAVLAACSDPWIWLYNPGPRTLEDAYAWCRGRADWTDATHASWLVKDTSGQLVGAMSIFQINDRSASGQAGYWVTADARGRGVATAVLSAAARFGFGALGLVRIELFHALENEASCRTALAAGFAQEGVHRQSFRYGDGVLRDEHSHARLATD